MKLMTAGLILLVSAQAFAVRIRGPIAHERTSSPKMTNMTSGRYMYLGEVPKFEGKELEIFISKMNLTARVKAHVNQGRIDTYANQIFLRWKTVRDAVSDPVFSLHPLVKLSTLSEGKPANVQAWSKIAEQYSTHVLEQTGHDIYQEKRNKKNFSSNSESDDYRETIIEAYFSYLFNTKEKSDDVINDNKKLADLLSVDNSRRLFEKHLGHLYTKVPERSGYSGTLTFVYPIAATVEGPFDQPREQVISLKAVESLESRWWSDKWKDEFGGFPFLLIDYNGVAFHGPITNYSPMDVWYLRRGYVSHGCHRMDSSDLLELRALMPGNLKSAQRDIKITVLNYFDVTDWNKDGKEEAIDVKYYTIPTAVAVAKNSTIEKTIAPFLIENQEKSYLLNNKFAAKYVDKKTGNLLNIPRYSIEKNVLSQNGTHNEIPFVRFAYRPNRIIQYTEDGTKLTGHDDLDGKYPPKNFQKY